MKRSIFLVLLILHCPVSVANDIDLANRALDRGDYATAAAAFRKLAEQGDVKAQSHLGYLYYAGEGVPQSYEEAVKWYRKAATQGDADAQYNLAVAYAFGEGVEKNLLEAATWYRRAAEQGHPVAQYSLGISHAYGEGVKQDGALAARWFLQAAEQDYEPAQVMIASIYHTGDGIPQDHAKAARWYRRAAEKGNAVAQYNLGTLYRAGKGVVKNNAVAVRWFTKAARQGYAAAQKELQGMQQAVTVAPGAKPAATPEPDISPEQRSEPETVVARSELPSGDLTSEQERKRLAGPQSDEALVTIRKEDLLTLEPEPETEPLATVDEISGVEYQGAPTAKPANLKEETEKETAIAKPFEKQPPVKADTVVTKPAVEPGVTENETGTDESGPGVLSFFKKIFSADNKTETSKIGAPVPTGPVTTPYTPRPVPATVIEEEQPQVAVEKKTTAGPTETAPVETPYKPRPATVRATQPAEQTTAKAVTPDTGKEEVEEGFEWGRPRSRAPQENTASKATSYADGTAPAGQQLEEKWEETQTAEISRIEKKEITVAADTESEDEMVITATPETSPPEESVTGVTGNTDVVPGDKPGAEKSGGLGNFFKRLFGGDENKVAGTEPEVAEQTVTQPATEQAEDSETLDEVMENEEPVLIARAEPESVDVPVAEEAMVAQEEELPSFDDTLSHAVEGNADSQYELATMYYKGDGVERDLEQAFIWYRRAAQQGNADAQFNLANMYLLGEGTSENDSKAKDWFEKAAAQGHIAAADNLDNLQQVVASEDESPAEVIPVEEFQSQETVIDTAEPEPIKKTASVTKEDLEAAAEPETSGDPGEDSYTRGMAYAYGEGAQQNYEMAFKYFQHAAEQGYVPAQYRLGVAYANGEGTEQDYVAALTWYQKAARQGYVIAQRSLCKMYLEGLGVEQNKPLALAWYSILAEHGNVMDTHRRDQLARELTEAERQQAEILKQELTASITTASSGF